jgi:UDP-glucose 4-epimerase
MKWLLPTQGGYHSSKYKSGDNLSNPFKSTVVTITGGTGSFGSTMVGQLLSDGATEVRIFSRDETKQSEMRNNYKDERLKFIIGDVRDQSSLEPAFEGSDYVFHAAALKQVPSCEFFPMQAVATNINGSSNVINCAVKYKVKSVVCLSSDKAVYPINAMGMTKAIMEKIAMSYSRSFPDSKTKISITRYGNVMMSRGSVIPLFFDQIRRNEAITITSPSMTRFMMSLKDSVSLVKYAFLNATNGDLFVRKAPACTVETLAEAVAIIAGVDKKVQFRYIGTRHGEKLYESLLGNEERYRSVDCGDYFKVPLDSRSLDYQIYYDKGQAEVTQDGSYNSHNTRQLTVEEVVKLITDLPEYSKYMEITTL